MGISNGARDVKSNGKISSRYHATGASERESKERYRRINGIPRSGADNRLEPQDIWRRTMRDLKGFGRLDANLRQLEGHKHTAIVVREYSKRLRYPENAR